MYKKIMSQINGLTDSEDGGFNTGKLWKLKKKLSPRCVNPPSVMVDSNGKILTSEEDIKDEAIKHYKKVFKSKVIKQGLEDMQKDKEMLCLKHIEKAYENKTLP